MNNLDTLWSDALPLDSIPAYPKIDILKSTGVETTFDIDDNHKGAGVRIIERPSVKGELLMDSDLRYISDWSENLKHRILVQQNSLNNPEYQEMQKLFCKSSVAYFINTFCWTFDPRLEQPHVPFCTYEFQEDLITWTLWRIRNKQTGLIEKSRDMGATWCMEALSLYITLFFDGMVDYQFSLREDDVDNRSPDSLLGKYRYLISNLPDWLQGGWAVKKADVDNKMNIKIPDTKSTVRGQLTGGTAGRSGRATHAFLDEFAFIDDAEKVLMAMASLTPASTFLSTPNGAGNKFYDMAHDSRVDKKTLHWTRHPLKNKKWERKERAKVSYTDETWSQEQDICYELSTQGRVYPNFKTFTSSDFEWCHLQEGDYYDFDPTYDVYVGMDFGMADPTSAVFAQIKPTPDLFKSYSDNTLIFFKEIEMGNKSVDEWAAILKDLRDNHGYVYRQIVGDYRTGNQRDATKGTWIKYLRQHGFHISGRYNTEQAPILEVKRKLELEGALAVNKDNCPRLVKAFQNWAYPVDRKTKLIPYKAAPKHDQWSHSMKATAYLIDKLYGRQERKNDKKMDWNFSVMNKWHKL